LFGRWKKKGGCLCQVPDRALGKRPSTAHTALTHTAHTTSRTHAHTTLPHAHNTHAHSSPDRSKPPRRTAAAPPPLRSASTPPPCWAATAPRPHRPAPHSVRNDPCSSYNIEDNSVWSCTPFLLSSISHMLYDRTCMHWPSINERVVVNLYF
jgi:hypothetical protein